SKAVQGIRLLRHVNGQVEPTQTILDGFLNRRVAFPKGRVFSVKARGKVFRRKLGEGGGQVDPRKRPGETRRQWPSPRAPESARDFCLVSRPAKSLANDSEKETTPSSSNLSVT